MPITSLNIIEELDQIDGGTALIACLILMAIYTVVWFILRPLLSKCKTGSFGDIILEIGPIAGSGALIFFAIILILLISSFQAVLDYGAIMTIPLIIFWGAIIAIPTILIVRYIKKKK